MVEPTIIFEDQDLLVLSKPPAWVVTRSETTPTGTVQDWLEAGWPQIFGAGAPAGWADWVHLVPDGHQAEYGTPEAIFAQRAGIAHRLDKDTSGLLVVAKNPGALLQLLAQFRERVVEKQYLCLVHGKLAVPEGEVDAPLGRSRTDRMSFAVTVEGRAAVTRYQVEQFYPSADEIKLKQVIGLRREELGLTGPRPKLSSYQGFSLVRCFPKTGRTHQIRVHMAHLHHPIVGDQTYAGKKRATLDQLWCPRQFLHATAIGLQHPRTGERLEFSAPLPADLATVLTYLKV